MSASQTQMEALIGYVEDHPVLAINYSTKSTQGRAQINALWEELTELLNSIGLPNKTTNAWRKVWTDYKYRAKRKLSQNMLSKNKTGGGPLEEVPLNDMEERVASLAGLKDAVSGNGGKRFGAASVKPSETVETLEFEYLEEDAYCENDVNMENNMSPNDNDSQDDDNLPPKRRKYSKEQSTNALLKEQLDNDKKFQARLLNILEQRNTQDQVFQNTIVELLKEKNQIEIQKMEIFKID